MSTASTHLNTLKFEDETTPALLIEAGFETIEKLEKVTCDALLQIKGSAGDFDILNLADLVMTIEDAGVPQCEFAWLKTAIALCNT